jgi:RNA polymerase sigma factor (sigma-70 family)
VKTGGDNAVNRAGLFRTTRWSLILGSIDIQTPGSKTALTDLCNLYWYPLYVFARRTGFDGPDAEDLTQSFFLYLLEKKSLGRVTPDKGRFRSFLLASFKNHISNVWRRDQAAKRGGNCQVVSMDLEKGEIEYTRGQVDDVTAEKIYDARWAITLLDRAKNRLFEEYVGNNKRRIYERLKSFLTSTDIEEANSYQKIGQELGITVAGVKTLVFRLRRRFAALLREEVGHTVADPSEIDAELHTLCEALVTAESRLE